MNHSRTVQRLASSRSRRCLPPNLKTTTWRRREARQPLLLSRTKFNQTPPLMDKMRAVPPPPIRPRRTLKLLESPRRPLAMMEPQPPLPILVEPIKKVEKRLLLNQVEPPEILQPVWVPIYHTLQTILGLVLPISFLFFTPAFTALTSLLPYTLLLPRIPGRGYLFV